MANIFDYIEWRGDLSFKQDPFNEVDNVILSRLSYLSYKEIVPENFKEFISLSDIANNYIIVPENKNYSLFEEDLKLLNLLKDTNRFKDIGLAGFIDKKDYKEEKQFAAITFKLSKNLLYISFRGTDHTAVGWKENFNMLYKMPVPSQLEALNYLSKVYENLSEDIIVGGHSKGGNLAVYAAVFSNDKIKSRIKAVYNNDGPGFRKEIIETDKFLILEDRIHTLVPESSVVGMMLERMEKYTIVESEGLSVLQHNLYLWKVFRNKFFYLESVDNESRFVNTSMRYWLDNMNEEQIEIFVNTLFGVLDQTGGTEVKKLNEQWYEMAKSLIKSLVGTDEKTREAVLAALQIMYDSAEIALKENKKI